VEHKLLTLIKQSKKETEWTIGNNVLYQLCREYPFHKGNGEIG